MQVCFLPEFYSTVLSNSIIFVKKAGVVALMLEASNHRLSPRDIAHILVETSTFSPQVKGQENGAGKLYHDQVGFGYINAGEAVRKSVSFPGITSEEVTISFLHLHLHLHSFLKCPLFLSHYFINWKKVMKSQIEES